MTARRVLVTGVGHELGAALARNLSCQPAIDQVIGVDTVAPVADLGAAQYVHADIRQPRIATLIANAEIDAVAHLGVLSAPLGADGRAAMKETNVIGTMQLLGACQRARSVRTLVVRSSVAVYGASPHDPALFTEETPPHTQPTSGYAKDVVEVEGYVRSFQRRRPDVVVCTLRCTHVLGPHLDSSLARYLALAVAPTVIGFDPRLQLLHPDDARAVLEQAITNPVPGVFNVAGDGVLLLSQALRRLGRPVLPMPAPAFRVGGQLLRRAGLADYSPEQLYDFERGRAVDTTALQHTFGFRPAYSTADTFEQYAAAQPGVLRRTRLIEAVEQVALGLLGGRHVNV